MLLQKHQDQQSFERQKLAKNQRKCLSHSEKYLRIVMDGIDQKKTRLPHLKKIPKSIDESCVLQLHVVGCLIYHIEIFSRVFLNYPSLQNDGNLTITILQNVLNEWKIKPGGLLPTLYFQLDNTCRENKNTLLFSYLHMLFVKKIF
jgi:hypothetical protein